MKEGNTVRKIRIQKEGVPLGNALEKGEDLSLYASF